MLEIPQPDYWKSLIWPNNMYDGMLFVLTALLCGRRPMPYGSAFD